MVDQSSEHHFMSAVEQVFHTIEQMVDDGDADYDSVRQGNVLTITLENHDKVIVNSQAAMREIWVAAKQGGFHYRQDDTGVWRDTKSSAELMQVMQQLLASPASK
jgi:CyaY protein